MDLSTSSNHPFTVTIDGTPYTVERLNMGDLAGISQSVKRQRREAVEAEYAERLGKAEASELAALDRERINAVAAVEGPGPSELMGWLLTTVEGMTTALAVALHKKQPDVPYDMITNLAFDETLLQVVYDILGTKLKVVEKPAEKAEKAAEGAAPFPEGENPTGGTG